MKVSTPTLILTFTSLVTALPASSASEPEWCVRRGEPCHQIKRAITSFADGLVVPNTPEAGPDHEANSRQCNLPGKACWKAKRAIDSLAGIVAAATDESSQDIYENFALPQDEDTEETDDQNVDMDEYQEFCSRPGQSCFVAKRAATALLDSLSEEGLVARRERVHGWCERPGQPCFKKREDADVNAVATEPETELDARRERVSGWCSRPGQPCFRKRDDFTSEASETELLARSRTAGWCSRPGQPCFKSRQVAVAEEGLLQSRAPRRYTNSWCARPGQPCFKRSADALVMRDVYAMANAAREVLESV